MRLFKRQGCHEVQLVSWVHMSRVQWVDQGACSEKSSKDLGKKEGQAGEEVVEVRKEKTAQIADSEKSATLLP